MHTLKIVNKSMLLKLSMNCSSGKIGPHLANWFQDKMTGIPQGGAFRVSRPSGNGLARAHFLWNVGYADLMASPIFRGALSLLMAHFSQEALSALKKSFLLALLNLPFLFRRPCTVPKNKV